MKIKELLIYEELKLSIVDNDDFTWALFIACICHAGTRGRKPRFVFEELIKKYPTPQKMAVAELEDVLRIVLPLNNHTQRATSLKTFSWMWMKACVEGKQHDVNELKEMAGIGRYALECYAIFVQGDESFIPKDRTLRTWWQRKRLKQGLDPMLRF